MIIKQTRRKRYTMIDNASLRDAELSFKATGLLCFLLSLPDEWKPNSKHLAGIKTDGRDSVRAGLRELEDAGYLRRQRIVLPNGTFDWIIEVHEERLTMDGKSGHGGPETVSPGPGNPSSGNPSPENPASKESLRLTTDEVRMRNAARGGSPRIDVSQRCLIDGEMHEYIGHRWVPVDDRWLEEEVSA